MYTMLTHLKAAPLVKAACLLSLMALVGCGETSYETAPVSGTVMLGGKPAPNVFVQFEPAAKQSDDIPSSTAITDSQGKYALKLSVSHEQQGAVIGEHVVRFAPAGDPASAATEGPQAKAPVVRLPQQATNGDMRFTVSEEGSTNANFEL